MPCRKLSLRSARPRRVHYLPLRYVHGDSEYSALRLEEGVQMACIHHVARDLVAGRMPRGFENELTGMSGGLGSEGGLRRLLIDGIWLTRDEYSIVHDLVHENECAAHHIP